MFKKHLLVKLIAITMLVALIVGFAALAQGAGTSAGTSSDPLVTLSYVDETFRADLLEDVQEMLDSKEAAYQQQLQYMVTAFANQLAPQYPTPSVESSWATYMLSAGDQLPLYPGQQVLVIAGSGSVSENMIVDTTAGKSLTAGNELTENHLYSAPAECVITTKAGMTVLVK